MRVARLSSSLRLGERIYASHFHSSIGALRLATITTAVILLSAQSVSTSPSTGKFFPVSDLAPSYDSASIADYDCSAGGRIGKGEFSQAGLEEGINEALVVLNKCTSCKKFYGSVDPKELLERLVATKKIIVTKMLPRTLIRNSPKGKWRIDELKSWRKTNVAAAVNLSPKLPKGVWNKPCIYVNPSQFLVVDVGFEYSDTKGLSRKQARALALLHELAHIANVIPRDDHQGNDEVSSWKSSQNTLCVRQNCFECLEPPTTCIHPPIPSELQNRKRRKVLRQGSSQERKHP